MLRNRLMTGVVVLVLLGAIAGCGGDVGQPPEAANTLEQTVEETIVVLEQPAEEANTLEQPAEETNIFTIKGWVIVDAYHYDAATGTYVHFYHDESSNLIVDIGLQWIEDQLGGDTPSSVSAQYISLSCNTTDPAAGWSEIPTEIIADGLERAAGDYSGGAISGNWTIIKTFTAAAAFTDVQLTGLQWEVGPPPDSTLLAANKFTAVSLADGDSLTVTWTLTVSGP